LDDRLLFLNDLLNDMGGDWLDDHEVTDEYTVCKNNFIITRNCYVTEVINDQYGCIQLYEVKFFPDKITGNVDILCGCIKKHACEEKCRERTVVQVTLCWNWNYDGKWIIIEDISDIFDCNIIVLQCLRIFFTHCMNIWCNVPVSKQYSEYCAASQQKYLDTKQIKFKKKRECNTQLNNSVNNVTNNVIINDAVTDDVAINNTNVNNTNVNNTTDDASNNGVNNIAIELVEYRNYAHEKYLAGKQKQPKNKQPAVTNVVKPAEITIEPNILDNNSSEHLGGPSFSDQYGEYCNGAQQRYNTRRYRILEERQPHTDQCCTPCYCALL
jgi:hypothetical protein